MDEFRSICRVDDVPPGTSQLFVIEEKMIGLFNQGGEIFALANECPHAGASLAHGCMEDGVVRCRIHHWRFSLRTGQYLDETNPNYDAVTFRVRIVGREVQVEV